MVLRIFSIVILDGSLYSPSGNFGMVYCHLQRGVYYRKYVVLLSGSIGNNTFAYIDAHGNKVF